MQLYMVNLRYLSYEKCVLGKSFVRDPELTFSIFSASCMSLVFLVLMFF